MNTIPFNAFYDQGNNIYSFAFRKNDRPSESIGNLKEFMGIDAAALGNRYLYDCNLH